MVYDKDGILVGALCDDDVTLVEGGKNIVDFIAADAPAFKDKDASLADSSLLLATDPEAEDGVVTIAVGENVTVTAVFSDDLLAIDGVNTVTHVYERFSPEDFNRDTVTLYLVQGSDGIIHASLITAGGALDYDQQMQSDRTVGEDHLLNFAIQILESLQPETQLPEG